MGTSCDVVPGVVSELLLPKRARNPAKKLKNPKTPNQAAKTLQPPTKPHKQKTNYMFSSTLGNGSNGILS